ncbi:hypothetical protein DI09_8p180 [Mitosporidium daphniae]|uniref:Uncharacterized protein n=1 Tax=Mitosporidium daphniae TaxID=1485682 RepID=A0A098VMP2_9MICR|nr:uncharacterized protein DI09_8p180 [Mitosporidium daphniae]KGG50079.1 hypothetical protein DI09_8p180 [Mitosporidium daphniae]|eukprot:XP_013236506.1 uncharacterized protein DI09_8p180 [Mitosporidium daphniae]
MKASVPINLLLAFVICSNLLFFVCSCTKEPFENVYCNLEDIFADFIRSLPQNAFNQKYLDIYNDQVKIMIKLFDFLKKYFSISGLSKLSRVKQANFGIFKLISEIQNDPNNCQMEKASELSKQITQVINMIKHQKDEIRMKKHETGLIDDDFNFFKTIHDYIQEIEVNLSRSSEFLENIIQDQGSSTLDPSWIVCEHSEVQGNYILVNADNARELNDEECTPPKIIHKPKKREFSILYGIQQNQFFLNEIFLKFGFLFDLKRSKRNPKDAFKENLKIVVPELIKVIEDEIKEQHKQAKILENWKEELSEKNRIP